MTAIADAADFDCEFTHDLFRGALVQATLSQRSAGASDAHRSASAPEHRHAARALALTAAAVEEWVTSALLTARVPIPMPDSLSWHGALPRWRRLPDIARSLGRPHDFALSEEHRRFLENLGAWHHALTYADPHAQSWLHDRYRSLGQIDGRHNVTQMMSAGLACIVVAGAGELFDWASQVTGLPAPG